MTTETTNTTAAAIAAGLTAGERAALQRVSKGVDAIGYYPRLMELGLIATKDNVELGFEEGFVLTDLGKRVLAHVEATPAEANQWEEEKIICSAEVDVYMDTNEKSWPESLRTYYLSKLKIEGTMTAQRIADIVQEWLNTPAEARPEVSATDAGGRYRLRRWDAEIEEWVDGVSQPWDQKTNAIEIADAMALRRDERYMVVDRLFNPVYDTAGDVVAVATAELTARPDKISAAQFVEQGYKKLIDEGECVVDYNHLDVTSVNRHHGDWYMVWGKWENGDGVLETGHLLAHMYDLLGIEWLTPAPAQPAPQAGTGGEGDDSWKFRKLGAGVSPTDYRETLSREGLLDYLKEREAKFEEIYQGEYDKRSKLNDELAQLRSELAASRERATVAVEALKRIQRISLEESIGYPTMYDLLAEIASEALQPKDAAVADVVYQGEAGMIRVLKSIESKEDKYPKWTRVELLIDGRLEIEEFDSFTFQDLPQVTVTITRKRKDAQPASESEVAK